jgi:cyclic pyranopterin phosphate synthase
MAKHDEASAGGFEGLSHLDERGHARMVDVSAKPTTAREATARGRVLMSRATLDAITSGAVPKGDVFATARVAGILAAKRTAELIPLCHPLPLSGVEVALCGDSEPGDGAAEAAPFDAAVEIEATARTTAQTGVEMEALTAVSVAALTVYDMCKSLERGMRVDSVRLTAKSGGASGDYRAD